MIPFPQTFRNENDYDKPYISNTSYPESQGWRPKRSVTTHFNILVIYYLFFRKRRIYYYPMYELNSISVYYW